VQAVEHQLAVVLLNERSRQRRVAGAQGLHLVTNQDYPGLICLENRVVMPGPSIRGDGPTAFSLGRGDLLAIPSGTHQWNIQRWLSLLDTLIAARRDACSHCEQRGLS
jgi:hypothetical protein